MRCSASGMFATDNVNSCTCVIRKPIISIMTRIATSLNPIVVKSIVGGGGGGAMCIVRRPSVTYGRHCCILCRYDLHSNTLLFHYFSMDTLYNYYIV